MRACYQSPHSSKSIKKEGWRESGVNVQPEVVNSWWLWTDFPIPPQLLSPPLSNRLWLSMVRAWQSHKNCSCRRGNKNTPISRTHLFKKRYPAAESTYFIKFTNPFNKLGLLSLYILTKNSLGPLHKWGINAELSSSCLGWKDAEYELGHTNSVSPC